MKIISTVALNDTQRSAIRNAAPGAELTDRQCRAPEEIGALVSDGCDVLLTFRDLLLNALQREQGRACFGYCDRCDRLRVIHEHTQGKKYSCGLTGDELPADELTRLCVNFKASD